MLTRLLDGDLNSVAAVVNILAFLVQNPGQRLRYIPCFVNRASFNKELLGHLLVTLLGDKNTYVPDTQAFSGQFADWLLRTSTVLLNHVHTNKAFQDRMFHLLTAPELSVLLKGKNSTQVPNVLNQVAFARELGDLEHFADPRRLGIFEMSETPVTSEEYAAFKAWLDGDGKAHALHALLHHDLAGAGFDPQQAPSNLGAQGQLDALSRSPIQDYLQEALVSVSSPLALDLVNVNDITRALLGEGHRVTNADVLKALKELGAVRLGQIRNVEGQEGKPNYWAVRQQAFWSAQSEGARRAYLEEAAQARQRAGLG